MQSPLETRPSHTCEKKATAINNTTESSGKRIRDGRYFRSKVKANNKTKALDPVLGIA